MPPFHRSVRDLTDKAVPALFFFVVVASVTVVLTYSNGFKEPVPRNVTTGLTATLGILVFLFALGRTLLYFKGTLPPELDIEQASVTSRPHPTMAPVSPANSTGQQSSRSQRRRGAAVVHTAPYPESDIMLDQNTPSIQFPPHPMAAPVQNMPRPRQLHVGSPSHVSQYRPEREIDPYRPYQDLQRLQPYQTPTRTQSHGMSTEQPQSGRSGRYARPLHQQRQLGRTDARRGLPSSRQEQIRENLAINNVMFPESIHSLQFPLLSFLMKHALSGGGSAREGCHEKMPGRLVTAPGSSCGKNISTSVPSDGSQDWSGAETGPVEWCDGGSRFSSSSAERLSLRSDSYTVGTIETSEEMRSENEWEHWG